MLTRVAIILLCLSAVYLIMKQLRREKRSAENKEQLSGRNSSYLTVIFAMLSLLILLFPKLNQLRERFRNNR